MNYLIDGEPEYIIGFDVDLDDFNVEAWVHIPWSAKSPEIEAIRKENAAKSWEGAIDRKRAAAERMSMNRKSGVVKNDYTPERNAKVGEGVKRSWTPERRLARSIQAKAHYAKLKETA